MNIQEALLRLQEIITLNLYHADYTRVVYLANLYRKLITGQNQESLLIQFVRREDPLLFAQRKALTQSITPAVAEAIMNPFFRVGRLDNAKTIIDYPEENPLAEKAIAEIKDRIATFWGEESLDKYLGARFTQLSFMDPNAWQIVEFDAFDSRYEKARPYPIECSATEAIDFRMKNNKTEYLVVRKPIFKINKDKVRKEGFKYIMYLENTILQYTQYLEDEVLNVAARYNLLGFQSTDEFFAPDAARRFTLQVFNPKGGEIQAVRIGYKGDLETDSRTFVNPFHSALAYFMKTIKSVSEMDLTASLHVFPQKLQYVDNCEGEPDEPCYGGLRESGTTCGVCKGSGVKIHTTAQDAITLPMPDLNKAFGGQYLKLDDILVYKSPPVELLNFQKEYIDDLTNKAVRAVFNSGILTEASIEKTATATIENKDELYNTLHPFAENYSSVWKKDVRLIAAFTDNAFGLRVVHEFPGDLKLKNVAELLQDLKHASDANAPAFVIQQINKDIAAKMFADDQTAFLKFIIKNRFMPFLGKSSEEIKFIISSGYARVEDRVLWSHSDTIFDELELEIPDFFLFTYEKQIEYVDKKVKKIIEGFEPETPAIDFRGALPGSEGDDAIDADAEAQRIRSEAQASLRGSVGGTQGVLAIQASVGSGATQYDSGIAILESIYGYSTEEAKRVLGTPKMIEV